VNISKYPRFQSVDYNQFDWPNLNVLLNGESFIDHKKIYFENKKEAKAFILSYGYDIDRSTVQEEVWRLYFEAVAFINNHLLNEGEEIPVEFLERTPYTEITKLLVTASKGNAQSRMWACAILRVIHCISHLDNDLRMDLFVFAREQIFERFDQFVYDQDGHHCRIGDNKKKHSSKLIRYIKKERKERSSFIMKLLSKAQIDTASIYDSLGLKFVTESKIEAFQLLNTLIQIGALSPAHLLPRRSMNSLLPLKIFLEKLTSNQQKIERGEISIKEAEMEILKVNEENFTKSSQKIADNPNTSSSYSAIQFTCRQLIQAPDPTYQFWKKTKAQLEENPETVDLLKKIPIALREKRVFYYPFELQIFDKKSYVESIRGRSKHREYKLKQRSMARNRVLRDLI